MKIKTRIINWGTTAYGPNLKFEVISEGLNAKPSGGYEAHMGTSQDTKILTDLFNLEISEGDKYEFNVFKKKRVFGDKKIVFKKRYEDYVLGLNWCFCKGMFNRVLHTLKISSKNKKRSVSFYVSMKKV